MACFIQVSRYTDTLIFYPLNPLDPPTLLNLLGINQAFHLSMYHLCTNTIQSVVGRMIRPQEELVVRTDTVLPKPGYSMLIVCAQHDCRTVGTHPFRSSDEPPRTRTALSRQRVISGNAPVWPGCAASPAVPVRSRRHSAGTKAQAEMAPPNTEASHNRRQQAPDMVPSGARLHPLLRCAVAEPPRGDRMPRPGVHARSRRRARPATGPVGAP